MKLYYDPISTTSRPVAMFAAEHGLALDLRPVSLFAGEHRTPAFLDLNPNGCVPVLVDGEFVLTECSAILKYIAARVGAPAYPSDLQERARVNAAMDWFVTNFHAAVGHKLAYPILFPSIYPFGEQALAEVTAAGMAATHRWLAVLDVGMIGSDSDYVVGDEITLADYLGASVVMLAEAVGVDFESYPNVPRWLSAMKARPGWDAAYAPFHAMLATIRGASAGPESLAA